MRCCLSEEGPGGCPCRGVGLVAARRGRAQGWGGQGLATRGKARRGSGWCQGCPLCVGVTLMAAAALPFGMILLEYLE